MLISYEQLFTTTKVSYVTSTAGRYIKIYEYLDVGGITIQVESNPCSVGFSSHTESSFTSPLFASSVTATLPRLGEV